MNRRTALNILGAGAAATVLASHPTAAGEANKPKPGHPDMISEEDIKHMGVITQCASTCEIASHLALARIKAGEKEHRATFIEAHEYTMDCAAICKLTASLMAHSSPFALYAHQACADACRDCAKVCDKVKDEKYFQQCAEICRNCEKMCRQMAKGGKHGGATNDH